MIATETLRKELFDARSKLAVLTTKKAVLTESKQKTTDTKAEAFIQKKEQKNKEYVEFLKREQEQALFNCQKKIEEIQAAADRKIALIQLDIDSKNKYYSEKIASLTFTTIQSPPPPPNPMIDRLEVEISDLETKISVTEKHLPVIEAIEKEELTKRHDQERKIKRQNAIYQQQVAYNSEEAIKARAIKAEADIQRQILILDREAEEEDRRILLEEEEAKRDRLLAKKELESLRKKRKTKE